MERPPQGAPPPAPTGPTSPTGRYLGAPPIPERGPRPARYVLTSRMRDDRTHRRCSDQIRLGEAPGPFLRPRQTGEHPLNWNPPRSTRSAQPGGTGPRKSVADLRCCGSRTVRGHTGESRVPEEPGRARARAFRFIYAWFPSRPARGSTRPSVPTDYRFQNVRSSRMLLPERTSAAGPRMDHQADRRPAEEPRRLIIR